MKTIYIRGELTAASLQAFQRDLAAAAGHDLVVEIDSRGGLAGVGLDMYLALKRWPGQTSAYVKHAGSAATLPMCGCQRVIVTDRSTVVTHAPAVWPKCGIGIELDELEQAVAHLRVTGSQLAGIYSERTGDSVEGWMALLKSQITWVGQGIVNAGLADEVRADRLAMAASVSESLDLESFPTRAAAEWRQWQREAHERQCQEARRRAGV
jgi:ATP-dependent protease ClpP protease subunit